MYNNVNQSCIEMLQEQIIDMSLHDDVDVIWCGDLNSRCVGI